MTLHHGYETIKGINLDNNSGLLFFEKKASTKASQELNLQFKILNVEVLQKLLPSICLRLLMRMFKVSNKLKFSGSNTLATRTGPASFCVLYILFPHFQRATLRPSEVLGKTKIRGP